MSSFSEKTTNKNHILQYYKTWKKTCSLAQFSLEYKCNHQDFLVHLFLSHEFQRLFDKDNIKIKVSYNCWDFKPHPKIHTQSVPIPTSSLKCCNLLGVPSYRILYLSSSERMPDNCIKKNNTGTNSVHFQDLIQTACIFI